MNKNLELYIFENENLNIIGVERVNSYKIELDEETNAKSEFIIVKKENLEIKKGYYLTLNGLYKKFNFIVNEVISNKNSNLIKLIALDISNMFDRKVIEKKSDKMLTEGIESFIKETIEDNFVNGDPIDKFNYLDIECKTKTVKKQTIDSDKGIYNFHTFMINCRQNKNIQCNFEIIPKKIKITIEYVDKKETLIDCTTPEITKYKKVKEVDPITKVTVFCPIDNSEYNLYLLTDHSTTTNANDPNRAKGKTEVISEEKKEEVADKALEIIMKNRYKHLVEFSIKKDSKLTNTKELEIGSKIKLKTENEIYNSYISAISLSNNNFINYKSGNIRINLLEKLKQNN